MKYDFNLFAAAIFAVIVAVTLGISFFLASKAKSSSGFFAAGGQIPWFINGVAFAGDYLSAASFLGICGMIAFYGYDGFLYSIGYLAGWIVALFVIAEPLKRMGKFTFADALDCRFNSRAIRLTAAVSTLAVSLFYLIPQMVGAGVLITPLFGLPHYVGVLMVGIVVITIVVTAGMVSTTYVQFFKGSLLVIFSAILTVMILHRGLTVQEDNVEEIRPQITENREEFETVATGVEELIKPSGDWNKKGNQRFVRFRKLKKSKKFQVGEIRTWIQLEGKFVLRDIDGQPLRNGKGMVIRGPAFLPCQTKTVVAGDGKVLVNGLPWGKGEGEADIQPVGRVRFLPDKTKPDKTKPDKTKPDKTKPDNRQKQKVHKPAKTATAEVKQAELATPESGSGASLGGSAGSNPGQSAGVDLGGSSAGADLGASAGADLGSPSGVNPDNAKKAQPGNPPKSSLSAAETEKSPLASRTKTGPLGPIEFLSTLQQSEVILWGKVKIDNKDKQGETVSTTVVYYPKPTSGNDILLPGNHPRFKGIRSDDPADKLNFLSLMLALFCGTAALPHILIRYYTVKDQASARKSTIVGIGCIGFFYILTLYLGLGAMTSGAMDVTNNNMAAPLLAKSMGNWLFAVISAIAFTTVLGTVSGLIIASSGAVVHDLMGGVFSIQMSDHSKVRIAKIASAVVGGIAIVLGILFKNMNVSYLVGWAFSVAASANLPALVMLLFWKRTTKQGIASAIVVGMVSSLGWILLSGDTYSQVYGLNAKDSIIPFSQPGIVTIPLGFLTLIVVSLLTRKNEPAE